MKELNSFREIAGEPYSYAEKWKKKTGKKVVGYFCSYTIEEIVHAAGALPFRIFGTKENITRAEAHLQAYCCSLVRGGLEDALSGRLGFIDGTVFPHTCDSIQRLSDIWRLHAGFPFHIDIILPVKLNTLSAREYMTDVIRKFKRDIEHSLGVSIPDESLLQSIKLYNAVRVCLEEIYRMRSDNPGIISGSDVYAVVKSAMVMDRQELLGMLKGLITQLKKASPANKNYKRIVLAGGVCNHPDIYPILEKAGSAVVWDELCTGTRYFEGAVAESGDPVAALSARYAERIHCPAKHSDVDVRGRNLVDIVKLHNAQGVIFLILKFCDPHSFDYPYMKEYLDAEKIPNMLLEMEERVPPEGQLATRFESFIEML
jgi:bcr-type benzoyl-CoA reductase subunit C